MTNDESLEIERLARALSDFRFRREGAFLQMKDEFWDKRRDECRAFVKAILEAQKAAPRIGESGS